MYETVVFRSYFNFKSMDEQELGKWLVYGMPCP